MFGSCDRNRQKSISAPLKSVSKIVHQDLHGAWPDFGHENDLDSFCDILTVHSWMDHYLKSQKDNPSHSNDSSK